MNVEDPDRTPDELPTVKELLFSAISYTDRLTELSCSENDASRIHAACNGSTPQNALMMLALDDLWVVRSQVARNPGLTDPATFRLLSEDRTYDVKVGLAANRNAPPDVLRSLILDENDDISGEAGHTLQRLYLDTT